MISVHVKRRVSICSEVLGPEFAEPKYGDIQNVILTPHTA